MKMKKSGKMKKKMKKGFSLIELLVAMFISTLIVITVVSTFVSAFRAQKNARNTQRDVEDAKASLEYLAKIIRMSSNVKPAAGGTATSIYMYNKSVDNCIRFEYNSGSKKIEERRCVPSDATNPCSTGDNSNFASDCSGGGTPAATDVSSPLGSAQFYIPNYGAVINPIQRVTIYMQMAKDTNARLQTTVSLRDYRNLNPTGQ
jgi:Tfp pilus assembly protein PilV